jgi:hypothetical protein
MRRLYLTLFLLFIGFAQPFAFAAKKPSTQASIPELTRVRILEIDATDPNHAEKAKLLGKFGVVGKVGLINDGTNFFNGPIIMDDSRLLYFEKVSLESLSTTPSVVKGTRYKGTSIALGKRVKVLEISPTDTHYAARGKILGLICTVNSYDLYSYGTGLYSGSVACDDGSSWYFSYWALEVVTSKVPAKPATALEIPVGTRVRIKSIGVSDPYYYDRFYLTGKDGMVDTTLKRTGSYYTGSVRMFGSPYPFTQIELDIYESNTNGSLSMGANIIPNGTMVQIEALGPFDKFYGSRNTIEGQLGVVGPSDSLRRIEETGFYSGSISVNGKADYYYQVAVSIFQGGLSSQKSVTLAQGTTVKILNVSSSDTNYKDRGAVVGKSGVVSGGSLVATSGPWLSGFISTTDGGYYYFTGVSVLVLGTPEKTTSLTSKETPATGTNLPVGAKVRVIDISALDGSFTYKSTLIGKIGSVSTTMTSYEKSPDSGLPYFTSGSVIIDGSTYYPYQWSFSIVSE